MSVADAVSSEPVKELRRYGIPAERALGYPSRSGRVRTTKGPFVSKHDHGRGISMTANAAGSTIRRTRLASTIAGVCIALGAAAQLQWGDAENAMDLFARRTAKGLAALTSGTATPADLPLPD